MTASEFLQQLAENLQCLQDDERASAMAYYHEYFEEAGEENEAEAAERLGSPQSVAERIIRELGSEGVQHNAPKAAAPTPASAPAYDYTSAAAQTGQKDNGGRIVMAILIILLTFPFWIAIPIVWFTIVFLLVFLPLVFAFAGIAAPIQAIFGFMTGNIASSMWDLGGGIFMIGLTMLLWYPSFKLAKLMTVGFGKMCAGIWRFLSGKEKNV